MKAAQTRVLLTGAGGGIGTAAANALAAAGSALLLAGRSAGQLAAQARALRQRHPAAQIEWHAGDLRKEIDIHALSARAEAQECNVVIHCAGTPQFGPLGDCGIDTMTNVLQTNLLAPMALTRALLPHMRGLPRAQVIFLGSALGAIGLPGFSVYCAGKFGLRGFAQALRRELADTGVRVQYLAPRSTRTAFNDAAVEAYNRATGTAMDSPEHVARALVRMMENESAETFLGFPEKIAARLNGLAPVALDGAFAKHRRSLGGHAAHHPIHDDKEMKNAH
ncbi:SDR family oxidoreductase [Ramlibacter sp.]|uniref:SDR family oxidoreductase n=1 Tax=Ramlibacter sp. TaxID=1917967 RepID=UPI003D0A42FC